MIANDNLGGSAKGGPGVFRNVFSKTYPDTSQDEEYFSMLGMYQLITGTYPSPMAEKFIPSHVTLYPSNVYLTTSTAGKCRGNHGCMMRQCDTASYGSLGS